VPSVTVIVLNWNGARLLPPCLEALAKQDLPDGELAVWVVDNASSDDSLAVLARDYPWVTMIRNDRNDGFAGGNNVGMRRVETPYVALTNNDARPEPDWVRRLLAPLQADRTGRLAAVTGKIVFLPRFIELSVETPVFRPGSLDGRDLGVRLYRVVVNGVDVTDQVLWDALAYGPEADGVTRFRWTKPAGRLCVPADDRGGRPQGPLTVRLSVAAEAPKELSVCWAGGGVRLPVADDVREVEFFIPEDVPLVDVLNNAGSAVSVDGYGGDRAYQEIDHGQYDRPEEVFAFCGGSVCFRTEALRTVGYFDDDFFMYYEDTDLSWRMRSAGWTIHYEPSSRTRHIHSASSVEWSPFFTFHVDRNRLLMLTKNAAASLAAREALRYPLTTGSLAVREVARSRHTRRRPAVRPTLLRLRVIGSYLRLLPRMLAKRQRLARMATVRRRDLETRWLGQR